MLFSLSQKSTLDCSQDSAANSSSLTNHNASPLGDHLASTPTQLTSSLSDCNSSPVSSHPPSTPTQVKNSLLMLRSPRAEDLKKKKGWMTPKGPKTKVAVQETNPTTLSRPCNGNLKLGSQGTGKLTDKPLVKPADTPEPSPSDEDFISFSPLSELPAELLEEEVEDDVVEVIGFKKALFSPSHAENDQWDSEESIQLFSDNEFLNIILDRLEPELVSAPRAEGDSLPSSSSQVEVVCLLAAPSNQPARTASLGDTCLDSTRREAGGTPAAAPTQSPQSVVLEQLRQRLTGSKDLYCPSVNHTDNKPRLSCSQTASPSSTQAMAPWKPDPSQGKGAQLSGLKQTDIGVLFGLKPLKDQQREPGSGSQEASATTSMVSGLGSQCGSRRGGRRERGAKSRATDHVGTQMEVGTASTNGRGPGGGQAGTQGESSRGGRWRSRGKWNHGGTDVTRPCPFYKKIPGKCE